MSTLLAFVKEIAMVTSIAQVNWFVISVLQEWFPPVPVEQRPTPTTAFTPAMKPLDLQFLAHFDSNCIGNSAMIGKKSSGSRNGVWNVMETHAKLMMSCFYVPVSMTTHGLSTRTFPKTSSCYRLQPQVCASNGSMLVIYAFEVAMRQMDANNFEPSMASLEDPNSKYLRHCVRVVCHNITIQKTGRRFFERIVQDLGLSTRLYGASISRVERCGSFSSYISDLLESISLCKNF